MGNRSLAGLPSDSGEYNFTCTQVDTNSEQLAFSSRRGKHIDIEIFLCFERKRWGEQSNSRSGMQTMPTCPDSIVKYQRHTRVQYIIWLWHKFISIYLGAASSPKKCRIWGFCNSRRERQRERERQTDRKKERKEKRKQQKEKGKK